MMTMHEIDIAMIEAALEGESVDAQAERRILLPPLLPISV